MLLIPSLNSDRSLFLDAFSFNSDEINSVAIVLESVKVAISNINLNQDREGRRGLRFIISSLEITKLEKALKIQFTGQGQTTSVTVSHRLSANSYKCQRIDTPPNSCETIYASDQQEANLLCALIANNKKWLGGVPTPGRCGFSIFR
jgi:hypothetical protein